MGSRASRTALGVIAVGLGCLAVVYAQGPKPYEYADRDGMWTMKTGDESMIDLKVSASERQTVLVKRDRIAEVLQSSQVLNPLKGVPIRANKTILVRADNAARIRLDAPIISIVGATIGKFFLNPRTGRVDSFTTEMPRIEIVTNDLTTAVGTWPANRFAYEFLYDEQGRQVFLEPRVATTTEDGRPVYTLDALHEAVIVTNGRPLWVPLTAEQFLRVRIDDARRAKVQEDEARRSSGGQPDPDDRSVPLMRLREYQKELSALADADRERPAYWARPTESRPLASGLTSVKTAGSRQVVMMNPDYFDPALRRTAVQVIACQYNYNVPYDSSRPVGRAPNISLSTLQRLVKGFEYGKLEALIDK